MKNFDEHQRAGDGHPVEEPLGAFEDTLLTEFKLMIAERSAAAPTPAARPVRRLGPARRTWLTGRTVAAGVVAVALAAGLATAALTAGGTPGHTPAPPGHVPHAGPPSPGQVLLDDFLNGAASHVRGQPAPHTPATGISYVLELDGWGGAQIGRGRICTVAWTPHPAEGSLGTQGKGSRCPSVIPNASERRALRSLTGPGSGHGYPDPATLPVSPGALLDALYHAADHGEQYWNAQSIEVGNVIQAAGGFSGPKVVRDYTVFTLIERLLQAPVSGRLRAALFQAVERIPHVTLDRHAVDEAGRPGIGIVLSSPPSADPQFGGGTTGEAAEFILQARTYRFLGQDSLWWSKFPRQPQRDQTQRSGIAVLAAGMLSAQQG